MKRRINFSARYKKLKGSYITTPRVCDWPMVVDGAAVLHKAKHKVIRRPWIVLYFDYPLNNPASFMFIRLLGFTRRDIFKCVYEGYSRIYSDTDKYDVWGHSMGDLVLVDVESTRDKSIFEVGVDS